MTQSRRAVRIFGFLAGTFAFGPVAAQDPTTPMPADPPVTLQTAEALGAPVVPMAPAGAPASVPTDKLFPRYELIKPRIAFWKKIFGHYSENQSVVHSMEHPEKVFEVLDFRDEAQRLSKEQLARVRRDGEETAKRRVDELLRSVHEKRHAPETLDGEERKLFDLFKDDRSDNRFVAAMGTFRAQRGLRERTEQALQVSRSYLPAMEGTFASYGLPAQLTRLPLVESSFNIDAYSKVGAAGLWQFIPSSARIYMRLNDVVDDRRDPWLSTDAAARHLRDDYALLGSWPLALTAYNHGRAGVAKGLREVNGTTLVDLIERYESRRFGFASQNFYAEFLAAKDIEREYREQHGAPKAAEAVKFEVVRTQHYVPYSTLLRLSGADEENFRRLNPGYRPEVMGGKLYVPPGHEIRVPPGQGRYFTAAYSVLGENERFSSQRRYFGTYKVRRGDTLGSIAKKHGISLSTLRGSNGLKQKSTLRVGQTLKIPPRGGTVVAATEPVKAHPVAVSAKATVKKSSPSTHKVKRGQTLSSIAKRYRISIAALREANGLGDSSHLNVGMRLKIPGKAK